MVVRFRIGQGSRRDRDHRGAVLLVLVDREAVARAVAGNQGFGRARVRPVQRNREATDVDVEVRTVDGADGPVGDHGHAVGIDRWRGRDRGIPGASVAERAPNAARTARARDTARTTGTSGTASGTARATRARAAAGTDRAPRASAPAPSGAATRSLGTRNATSASRAPASASRIAIRMRGIGTGARLAALAAGRGKNEKRTKARQHHESATVIRHGIPLPDGDHGRGPSIPTSPASLSLASTVKRPLG